MGCGCSGGGGGGTPKISEVSKKIPPKLTIIDIRSGTVKPTSKG
jgi:hypothetical protein